MAQQFLNNVLGNHDSAPKAQPVQPPAPPAQSGSSTSDSVNWYDSPYVKYVAIGVGGLLLFKLVSSSSGLRPGSAKSTKSQNNSISK